MDVGQRLPDGVLHQHERRRSLREQLEHRGVFALQIVGRVEEHDIGAVLGEGQKHRAGHHRGTPLQVERRQVLPDRFQRRAMALQKESVGGAAAERFDTDGAGSRIRVQKRRAFDARPEDVEEGLAQAVGCGARGGAGNAFQPARTELHLSPVNGRSFTVTRAVAGPKVRPFRFSSLYDFANTLVAR